MIPALLPVAVVGYLIGVVLSIGVSAYRSRSVRAAASGIFLLTWVVHLGAVLQQGIHSGRVPLTNLSEYLLVFGWTVMTLHLYVWFRLRVDIAGVVLPPIAMISAFVAWLSAGGTASSTPARGPWFVLHTTVSTLGMATLCVAFAMSLIFLIQHRALKAGKRLGLLDRLPALGEADQLGFQALLLGFILLTIGIASGTLVSAEVHHRIWSSGAKQVFSVLAWIVFAGILIARSALGFRGKKSAYLTIAGFGLGLLTVVGMSL